MKSYLVLFCALFLACSQITLSFETVDVALRTSVLPVADIRSTRFEDESAIGQITFNDSRVSSDVSEHDRNDPNCKVFVLDSVDDAEQLLARMKKRHGVFRRKNLVIDLSKDLTNAEVDEYRAFFEKL